MRVKFLYEKDPCWENNELKTKTLLERRGFYFLTGFTSTPSFLSLYCHLFLSLLFFSFSFFPLLSLLLFIFIPLTLPFFFWCVYLRFFSSSALLCAFFPSLPLSPSSPGCHYLSKGFPVTKKVPSSYLGAYT